MTRVVPAELQEDMPIVILKAGETCHEFQFVRGEPIAFMCLECRNIDETLSEIIHEEDCQLAGETKPTAYGDRLNEVDDPHHRCDCAVATDGGE